MSPGQGNTLRNVVAVARREFVFRGRTRTFRLTTAFLVIVGFGLALSPVIIRFFERGGTGDRIEVVIGTSSPTLDVRATLDLLLNASTTGTAATGSAPDFRVEATTDLAAARARALDGSSVATLSVTRTGTGDLAFTLYSKDGPVARSSLVIRQAVSSIAIQDRLNRAGIPPLDQAELFAPPSFVLEPADPNAARGPNSAEAFVGTFAVSFALSILLFMAIILYGQWVAFSVAEEKNSRVMEVVLAAATPFQLLTGKVVGVGGLALVEYVIVLVPAVIGVLLQGQIAALVFGSASVDLPKGISVGLLGVFGVMFILGFALYSVLYAGAASLVSRQEDVNQIVAPLTLISVAGYLVATYSSTGLIPIDAPLVVIMSFIPFFSPYLMLARFGQGSATPIDVGIAILLLVGFIPVALWVAARLYRSGVLLYGQRPTPRTLLRALRGQ